MLKKMFNRTYSKLFFDLAETMTDKVFNKVQRMNVPAPDDEDKA